jgi:F0F1-type ATP synthase assembly protein I
MTLATTLNSDGTDPAEKQTSGSDGANKPSGTPGRQDRFAGAGAGYTMVAAALLGVGIGYVIDAMCGTRPLWTILCFFLFLIAGTWQLIKETRK